MELKRFFAPVITCAGELRREESIVFVPHCRKTKTMFLRLNLSGDKPEREHAGLHLEPKMIKGTIINTKNLSLVGK